MSVTHSPDFVAFCGCGYISVTLSMRGRMQPATCDACQTLVNATRRPFRFDFDPCAECRAPINESQLFGDSWYRTDQPSTLTCPKCGSVGLVLQDLGGPMHCPTDDFPAVGGLIHAELQSNGRITIPDLHTECGSVWFTKTPALEIGTRVRATVASIQTMAVNVGKVEVTHHQGIRNLELQFEGVVSGG